MDGKRRGFSMSWSKTEKEEREDLNWSKNTLKKRWLRDKRELSKCKFIEFEWNLTFFWFAWTCTVSGFNWVWLGSVS